MPVRALVDDCPLYDLAPRKPTEPLYPPPPRSPTLAATLDRARRCSRCSHRANIASRRPLFEQYDAIVQSRTVRRPEQADAAVLALADGSALAVSIDCNGRRVAADPYRGTVEAVLECAANLACAGAEPLGTTNNLNFGNPEKPHIAWQLTEAVRGLGDACRALAAPIVGGNVSLYNEGADRPDLPDAGDRHGRAPARRPSRRAARLRERGRCDRARRRRSRRRSPRASSRSCAARRCPTACRRSTSRLSPPRRRPCARRVRAGALSSAHDIAEGGLAVALAECCLAGGLGAEVELGPQLSGDGPFAALFGEGAGGFVVSGPADALDGLAARRRRRAPPRVGRRRAR